jgi:hypothetical protein
MSAIACLNLNRVFCALLALLTLMACGCAPVRSTTSVVGAYELRGDGHQIQLKILPAGTFTETISFKSGTTKQLVGKWQWDGRASLLSLDDLWIPIEFAPDYIVAADSRSGQQPKYTEPGHWVVSAEYQWGTVNIDVFPDADIGFKKTSNIRN